MKTSKAITASFITLALVVLGNGCDGGSEGDRCNPDQSHNECNKGLTCQQPSTCVESYCCPQNASASSNLYCNGTFCPARVDAGTGGGDASTD